MRIGKHHTEETKKKMSLAHKGKKMSEEQKKKISNAMKGREFTEEHRKKISENVSKWYKENAESETEINRRAKLSELGKERMRVWREWQEKQLNKN